MDDVADETHEHELQFMIDDSGDDASPGGFKPIGCRERAGSSSGGSFPVDRGGFDSRPSNPHGRSLMRELPPVQRNLTNMHHARSSEPMRIRKRRRMLHSNDISMRDMAGEGGCRSAELSSPSWERSHSPNIWMSLATPPSANTWGTTPPNRSLTPSHFNATRVTSDADIPSPLLSQRSDQQTPLSFERQVQPQQSLVNAQHQTNSHLLAQQQPQGQGTVGTGMLAPSSDHAANAAPASSHARSPSSPCISLHSWGRSSSASPLPPPLFLDASPATSRGGDAKGNHAGGLPRPFSPPVLLQSTSRARTIQQYPRGATTSVFQASGASAGFSHEMNHMSPCQQSSPQTPTTFGFGKQTMQNQSSHSPSQQLQTHVYHQHFDFRSASPVLPTFHSSDAASGRNEVVQSPFAPLRDGITNISME